MGEAARTDVTGREVRTTLADLPARFREKAETLRRDGGADQPAVAWELAAELTEEALRGHLDEPLTMDEAVLESGYTRGHLHRLGHEGKVPFEADGTVLRQHLPKKPGSAVASRPSDVSSSRAQLARAVAGGE